MADDTYNVAVEDVPTLTINDPDGFDTIALTNAGVADFSGRPITGIEAYTFSGGGNAVTLSLAQMNAATTFTGGSGSDSLFVTVGSGQSIDLSGKIFASWGASGFDSITITAAAGATSVIGSSQDDTIEVARTAPPSIVDGGSGSDTLQVVGAGAMSLTSTTVTSIENLAFAAGGNQITVNNADMASVQTLSGSTGTDRITLAAGETLLDLGNLSTVTGGVSISLSSGSDTLVLQAGVTSATGINAIAGASGGDSLVIATSGAMDLTGTAVTGIESLTFNSGGNTITANSADVASLTSLVGGASGADILVAANGDAGLDLGNLTSVSGGVAVQLGSGGDNLQVQGSVLSATGINTVFGGTGTDRITLETAGTVDLTGVTVSSIERLVLNAGGNTIVANNADVAGLATINGGTGTDVLQLATGETGFELSNLATVTGGVGIELGSGNEYVSLRSTVISATEVNSIAGGSGSDTLILSTAGAVNLAGVDVSSIERINFAAGGNNITANAADVSSLQTLVGGSGTDILTLAAGETALDLSNVTVSGGVSVSLTTGGDTLTLRADQIGAAGVNGITGASGGDTLILSTAGAVDLAGAAMTGVETLILDSNGNTITANSSDLSALTTLVGNTGSGSDVLIAANGETGLNLANLSSVTGEVSVVLGDGGDNLQLQSGVLSASGINSVTGGSGTDRLTLTSGGAADLSGVAVSSVERIVFNAAGNTITANNADLAAVTTLNGGTGTDIIQLATGETTLDLGNVATVSGGVGIALGSGGDTLTLRGTVLSATEINSIEGGAGSDTLALASSGAVALNTVEVSSIEILAFNAGGNTVTVNQDDVASLTALTGGSGADVLALDSGEFGLDLSGVTSVTGGVSISLNGGNDTLTLRADAVSADGINAIAGGADTDSLVIATSGTMDLSNTAVTGVEIVHFNAGGNDVIADQADITGLALVNGGTGTDSLTVNMSGTTLSLAGTTFIGWSAGDGVTVNGTAANNSITGSAQADTIVGGLGSDTLTGGAGSDAFQYDTQAEGGDTITDFTRGAGGDVLRFGDMGFGGALTEGTYVGSAAGIGADNATGIIVLTGTGFANAAAAEAAIQAASPQTNYVFGFFNTTTNRSEFYADASSAAAGSSTLIARLGNSTSQASHDQLTADNVAATGGVDTTYFVAVEDVPTLVINDPVGTNTIVMTNGGAADFSTRPVSGIHVYTFNDAGNGITLSVSQATTATTFNAGTGNDSLAVVVGSGESIDVSAKTFNDWGAAGSDSVTVDAAAGAVSVIGSVQDDTIVVAPAGLPAAVDGGSGSDTLTFSATGTADLTATTVSSVETLAFSAGGNTVIVDNASLASVTSVVGSPGCVTDALQLASGETALDLSGLSSISGGVQILLGSGNETLSLQAGVISNDGINLISGGSGADTLALATSGAVDLTGTTMSGMEVLQFNAGGNTITVNNADMAGMATITGGTGTDVIRLADSETGLSLTSLTLATGDVEIQLGSGGDNLTLIGYSNFPGFQTFPGISAITGGSGSDSFTFSFSHTDLSSTAMTSIETINRNVFGGITTVNNADMASVQTFNTFSDAFNWGIVQLAAGETTFDLSNLSTVSGRLEIALGGGSDTLTLQGGVLGTGAVEFVYGGAGGFDTLAFATPGAVDLTGTALTSIEAIAFANGGNQITVNNADMASLTTLTGNAGSGSDVIQLASGETTLDLTNITTVTGGVSVLLAAGDETLTVRADTTSASGINSINGGTGTDTLAMGTAGTMDLSATAVTSIETLFFNNTGGGTIIVNNADMASVTSMSGHTGTAADFLQLAAGETGLSLGNLASVTGGVSILLGTGNETLTLQAGVIGPSGINSIYGGTGSDTLALATSGAVNLGAGTSITEIENIAFNAGGNTITATFMTPSGWQTLTGGSGTDVITLAADDPFHVLNLTNISTVTGGVGIQLTDDFDQLLMRHDVTAATGINSIDGGLSDLDSLTIQTAGTMDLSGTAMTGIERINYNDFGTTLVVNSADMASVTWLNGGAGPNALQLAAGETTLDLTNLFIASGNHTVTLGSGSDTLTLFGSLAYNGFGSGFSTIDGGSGTDTLVLTPTGNLDLSNATMTSIEAITLNGMMVTANNADMASVTTVTGTTGFSPERLQLAAGETTFDLSNLSTVTGGVTAMLLTGNETLAMRADVVSGDGIDTIYGDSGVDTLQVASSGTLDFTNARLWQVETVAFNAGGTAMIADETDLADVNTIAGGSSADSLTVNMVGTSVSLAGKTFSGWTTGDSITINGTTLGDAITGSSQNDLIVGGNGADVMAGGGGTDTFHYAASSEGGDTISDFTAGTGGDVLRLDQGGFGGQLSQGTYVGSAAGVGSNASTGVIILTGTGYANEFAAEAAINAANPQTNYVFGFFNTTTNRTEFYYDADSSAAGSSTLIASLSNLGSQSAHDQLVATNVSVVGASPDNTYFVAVEDVPTLSINDTAGFDTIVMTNGGFANFSTRPVSGIDAYTFNAAGNTIMLNATQAAEASLFTGGSGSDTLSIQVASGESVDLSATTFTGWGGTDNIVIAASAGAVSLIGSAQNDSFGITPFSPPSVIDGGSGSDRLTLSSLGTADLTATTLTDVETIFFDPFGGGNTLIVDNADMASVTTLNGAVTGLGTDILRLTDGESTLDLSNLTTVANGVVLQLGAGGDTAIVRGDVVSASGFTSIAGGSGSDTLVFATAGAVNLSGTAVTSIEAITFNAGGNTITANSADVTAVTTLTGTASGADAIQSVAGESVLALNNLTTVTGGVSILLNAAGQQVNLRADVTSADEINAIIGASGIQALQVVSAGAMDLTGTAMTGVERIFFSSGGNTITVNNADMTPIDFLLGSSGSGADVIQLADGETALNLSNLVTVIDGVTVRLDSGGDILTLRHDVTSTAEINSIVGGSGTDTLAFATSGAVDLTGTTMSSIEQIVFNASGNTITVNNADMTSVTALAGGIGSGADVIQLAGAESVLNLSNLTSVTGGVAIQLSSLSDWLTLNAGATSATRINTINGGSGTDILQMGSGGTMDLSATDVVSIETLWFNSTTSGTIIVNNADMASVTSMSGNTGSGADVLQLAAGETALNLSNLTSVTGGVAILLGTAGETLTLRNNVTSAGGINTITGGTGTDTLAIASAGAMDLTGTAMTSMERISFNAGGNTITVNNADMVDVRTLTGGSGTDIIQLADGETMLNLSFLQQATGGIAILLGAGGDTLDFTGNFVLPGINTITGGSGVDTFMFHGSGTDLSNVAMTSIETVRYAVGGGTLTVNQADINAVSTIIIDQGFPSPTNSGTLQLAAGETSLNLSNLTTVTGPLAVSLGTGSETLTVRNETLAAGGIDSINGGSGADTLTFASAGAVDLTGTTLTGIENITFNSGGNTLLVNNADMAGIFNVNANGAANTIRLADAENLLNINALFVSGSGSIALQLGSGGDTLGLGFVTPMSALSAIIGGSGSDTLATGGTLDLSATAMTSIETISLSPVGTNVLTVNNADMADVTSIIGGTSASDTIQLAAGETTLNLSNLSTVTGGVAILLGTGSDTLTLQAEPGFTANLISATGINSINGGSGTDTLTFSTSGYARLEEIQMTSIEHIQFNSAGNNIFLNASQAAAVQQITGGSAADSLIVRVGSGESADLSTKTFTDWGPGGFGDATTILATAGAVSLIGSAYTDGILVTPSGLPTLIDGGSGTDNLMFGEGGAVDLTSTTVTNMERFSFDSSFGGNTITVNNADVASLQLMIGQIGNTNILRLTDSESLLDLSFTGAFGGVTLQLGSGGDTLLTNHLITSATGVNTITGGSGIDTLAISTAGAMSLTGTTMTSIEQVAFNPGGNALTADDADFADVTALAGGTGADSLIINMGGSAFSLAGVTFFGWTGSDSILINGNAGANTITGSSQNDVIAGAAGADTLTGGAGSDVFRYTGSGDGGDTILDFTRGSGGDQLGFVNAGFGGDLNQGIFVGDAGSVGSDGSTGIIVLTGTGYADAAAAEAAIQAANTQTNFIFGFFNMTSGRTEFYSDADSSAAGSSTLVSTLDNATSQTDHDQLTAANVQVV